MNADAFVSLMAAADPALVVVTTAAEGSLAGCLVGFHVQSSISPPGYCLWLSKANHTYRVGLRATHFAVHFLTVDDLSIAERFGTLSGEHVDKFADVDFERDAHGVPLLSACPNRMVLERIALVDDGGDHVCVTARVLSAAGTGPTRPLRVSDGAHLDPGRQADERAIES